VADTAVLFDRLALLAVAHRVLGAALVHVGPVVPGACGRAGERERREKAKPPHMVVGFGF